MAGPYTFPYLRFAPLSEPQRRLAVWDKGKVIPNFDRTVWRWDVNGTPIRFSDYGDTTSEYGWEIDHIVPKDKGGSDDIVNLQPLHWRSNRAKADRLDLQALNALLSQRKP